MKLNAVVNLLYICCMQDSPHEQVILRDINRTFPAHDFFKEAGGSGQEALYRISKVNMFNYLLSPILHALKISIMYF